MIKKPYRLKAKVLYHLNDYTQVATDFGIGGQIKIQTGAIPVHLRATGSEFSILGNRVVAEDGDLEADLREAAEITVCELGETDK